MRIHIVGVLLMSATAALGHAQSPVAFEVASVKPSVPGQTRVGLRIDASHVEFSAVSMADLLTAAFQVRRYQLRGPGWLSDIGPDRFDVRATLPQAASPDQVPTMLQTLLVDRFGLVFHREQRERAVLALVVTTPDPHLEPSVSAAPSGRPSAPRTSATPDGTLHLEADGLTMAALADTLSRYVDRPVVDRTGLSGTYRIAMTLSREDMLTAARSAGLVVPPEASTPMGDGASTADSVAGISIVRSLAALGLALAPREAPVEEIVIDRLTRTPTPD